MLQFIDEVGRNANNQPVLYGPVTWDILNQVSSTIGGATYLIGWFWFLLEPKPTADTTSGPRTTPSRSERIKCHGFSW